MSASVTTVSESALGHFHPTLRRWFQEAFPRPTPAQELAWPVIASGVSTLLLAPTGSGKTLAAFLVAIDQIMFTPPGDTQRLLKKGTGTATNSGLTCEQVQAVAEPVPFFSSHAKDKGVRVLYVSPLKALGVDVERNLRSPIAGVRAAAERDGIAYHLPTVGVRSGDTPASERHRLNREPPEILITTPESLYLILTSRARDTLRTVDDGDRRRDPFAGRHETRLASVPFAGTAGSLAARRRPGRPAPATDRPVRDAAAAGGSGPAAGRRGSQRRSRTSRRSLAPSRSSKRAAASSWT